MRETLEQGEPRTPYLRDGETVRIEVSDPRSRDVFGRFVQTVRATGGSS